MLLTERKCSCVCGWVGPGGSPPPLWPGSNKQPAGSGGVGEVHQPGWIVNRITEHNFGPYSNGGGTNGIFEMDPLNKWKRMAVKSNQCKSINSCGCIISQSRPLVNLKPIAKKSSSEQLFSSFRQQLIMQDGNIKAKCLKPLYWKKELKWHDAPLHII